jgi:hypothetical protein
MPLRADRFSIKVFLSRSRSLRKTKNDRVSGPFDATQSGRASCSGSNSSCAPMRDGTIMLNNQVSTDKGKVAAPKDAVERVAMAQAALA